MTARTDQRAVLHRTQRRMDAERREFAERAVDAIKATQRDDGRPFDAFAMMRARMALRPLLDEFYGRWPNDTAARFYQLTVEESRAARAVPFTRARKQVSKEMRAHPDLIRAIEEAA